MAACETGTGVLEWMLVPLCDIEGWCHAVNEHQQEVMRALRKQKR